MNKELVELKRVWVEGFQLVYLGVPIDADGVFLPQCVDVVKQMTNDAKMGSWTCGKSGGAKGISELNGALSKWFYRVRVNKSQPDCQPLDWLIWDRGWAGHVGIVYNNIIDEANNTVVIEQVGGKTSKLRQKPLSKRVAKLESSSQELGRMTELDTLLDLRKICLQMTLNIWFSKQSTAGSLSSSDKRPIH